METPNKQNVQGSSNMLKKALEDPEYIKALNLFEKLENYRYKNGLYQVEDD